MNTHLTDSQTMWRGDQEERRARLDPSQDKEKYEEGGAIPKPSA
jgi:hypothetical protein